MGACHSVTSLNANDAILGRTGSRAPRGPRLAPQKKLAAADAGSGRSTADFSDLQLPRKASEDPSELDCSPSSGKPSLAPEVFFLRQGDIVYRVPVISPRIEDSSLLTRRKQLSLRSDSLLSLQPQPPKKGLRPKASTFSHPKQSAPRGLEFK